MPTNIPALGRFEQAQAQSQSASLGGVPFVIWTVLLFLAVATVLYGPILASSYTSDLAAIF